MKHLCLTCTFDQICDRNMIRRIGSVIGCSDYKWRPETVEEAYRRICAAAVADEEE